MIEREAAVRIVEEQLERDYQRELSASLDPMRMAVAHVEQHELVWIISWTSEKYLRTRNPDFVLAGNGPFHLDYELCWATTWMDDANRWIGPVLGLPDLPFVGFGDALLQERPDGVHWKTGPLVDYAAGRPFAWVDDEQSDLDHAHVTAHHRGPGLLLHVNPRIGLREADFHALADFAGSL
ncbi:YrhB domain-containing protein [Streptomyces sp. NPDC004044]